MRLNTGRAVAHVSFMRADTCVLRSTELRLSCFDGQIRLIHRSRFFCALLCSRIFYSAATRLKVGLATNRRELNVSIHAAQRKHP